MKCPKCGKEIKDDSLFCEYCFADIKIVPTYEANVEQEIHKTLADIGHDIHRETKKIKRHKERTEAIEQTLRKYKKIGICMIGMLILVVAAFTVRWFLRQHSEEYLAERAQQAYENGNADEALSLIQRALNLNDGSNDALLIKKSEYLQGAGRKEEALATAQLVAQSEDTNEEDRLEAYRRMIAVYQESGDYTSVRQLIESADLPSLEEAYQDYMVYPVVADPEPGNYAEEISLTLSVKGSGSIFYTTDGTIPDTGSLLYSSPIELGEGDYLIKAVSINHFGEKSAVISLRYHINVE